MNVPQRRLKIVIYRPKPAFRTIWANWLFKCEPLELEYLYTILNELADITLIDGQISKKNPIKEVRNQKADIFLATSLITNINDVLILAEKIKLLKNPPLVFVGGPHAEVVPEHFYNTNIDGVFFNNQLEGIKTVVSSILENRAYQKTPGAAFPGKEGFESNEICQVDYEHFPIPERPLLKKYKGKYNLFYFDDCASIKTSFGCPEKCTFCFCRKMNLGKYKRRPLQSVIDEIETIQNKNVFIVDDNFLLSSDYLSFFCDAIERKQIKKKFIVYATAHFIAKNPILMKRLSNSGLTAVLVGFEFLNDEDLIAYNKGSVSHENKATIKICKKLDIELIALFMINPTWSKDKFKELAKFVNRHQIYLATFATLTTLPGTELWKNVIRNVNNVEKWWRYDLLRLHEQPQHMSRMSYYFWLIYLYLKLAYRRDALKHFYKKAGFASTLKMIFNVHFSMTDFLIKISIWP